MRHYCSFVRTEYFPRAPLPPSVQSPLVVCSVQVIRSFTHSEHAVNFQTGFSSANWFFFYLIFTFMKVSTCDWSEEVTFISCKFNKLSGKSFCSLLKSATGWTTSGCSFNAAVRTARAERRCCCVWSCCLLVWGSLKTLNSLQGPVSRHCFPVP